MRRFILWCTAYFFFSTVPENLRRCIIPVTASKILTSIVKSLANDPGCRAVNKNLNFKFLPLLDALNRDFIIVYVLRINFRGTSKKLRNQNLTTFVADNQFIPKITSLGKLSCGVKKFKINSIIQKWKLNFNIQLYTTERNF